MANYDAIVVGSGPNGLAAAITLAQAGLAVKLYEAKDSVGGGARSAEITLPGFTHDLCSAVHPMAVASPFFRSLPLNNFGLRWINPPLAVAHPLDDGTAVTLGGLKTGPSFDSSNSFVVNSDIRSWEKLIAAPASCGLSIFEDLLSPLSFTPRHPLAMAKFGLGAMFSAKSLSQRTFKTTQLKALFGGMAGHSFLSFDRSFSSATALALILAAELVGWPIPAGGSSALSEALAAFFRSLGGVIELNAQISTLSELPPARIVLLDLTASRFASMCGDRLSATYQQQLKRFRPGVSVFKIDWALSEAVPWRAAECRRAGTLHLGGSYEELEASERAVARGGNSQSPFVILNQPSLFDESRAPQGRHTLWGYCHLPINSTTDMTDAIENQIERFAPGFKDCILAKKTTVPSQLESYNRNYTGGDISGGAVDWPQLFRRPTNWFKPYKTPLPNVYLCSASTPPGPGVHGMCGFHAARLALREVFGRNTSL